MNYKIIAKGASREYIQLVGIDPKNYDVSPQGFLTFIADFKKLARNRELAIERRNALNQYPKLFGIAAQHFPETVDFVDYIHNEFFQIIDTKTPVPFDTSGYRFQVAQGWSEKFNRFTYAGQFAFAIEIVFDVLAREEE